MELIKLDGLRICVILLLGGNRAEITRKVLLRPVREATWSDILGVID